jgi:hypothetical protein
LRRAYALSRVEKAASMAANKRDLVHKLHGRTGLDRDKSAPPHISLQFVPTTARVGEFLTRPGLAQDNCIAHVS